jgi:hypothetical protein
MQDIEWCFIEAPFHSRGPHDPSIPADFPTKEWWSAPNKSEGVSNGECAAAEWDRKEECCGCCQNVNDPNGDQVQDDRSAAEVFDELSGSDASTILDACGLMNCGTVIIKEN